MERGLKLYLYNSKLGVLREELYSFYWSNRTFHLTSEFKLKFLKELINAPCCLLLPDFLSRVEPFNDYNPESRLMQCDQIILPCQLSLLLSFDPHCVYFIHFLFLFGHIVLALLLKLRQLHCDLIPLPYVRLIQHLDGHVHRLQHRKPYPRVALRLPCLLIPVYLYLILPCDRIKSQNATSHKVISEFSFCDVGGESLDVDVVVDFGLEPFSFFVFLVALLF
jgi:hypothetical protein